MPELGQYGSVRGEARKSLPYRDYATQLAGEARCVNPNGSRWLFFSVGSC